LDSVAHFVGHFCRHSRATWSDTMHNGHSWDKLT